MLRFAHLSITISPCGSAIGADYGWDDKGINEQKGGCENK